ncbi:MAG: nucleosidase [Bacteroidaceae bacterium]
MNILITHALEEESFYINFEKHAVQQLITGCGKASSAAMLMEAICTDKPDLVINIGTSGTLNYKIGDVLVCRVFYDRDYEHLYLPMLERVIDNSTPPVLSHWKSVLSGVEVDQRFAVNTGDNFLTGDTPFTGDVVDMEAFAQAWVCRYKQIPFLSVKYVTDLLGQNSIKKWEDKLSDARHGLYDFFRNKQL